MPKLSNSLPKYRLHRASGQAIVTLAGKHHYLGPHSTKASRLEYDRLISEWVATGRPSVGDERKSDLTINELLAANLQLAQRYYVRNGAPTGEVECLKTAMRPLKQVYGRTRVTEFGPIALKLFETR